MEKLVRFEEYCHACKHFTSSDAEDPCDDCLNTPVNEDSHKPIHFEKG